MERILEGGFMVYVDILMEEDKYRSVRGGYYTKDWKEVGKNELEGELHKKIREIGKEFQEYVKRQKWLEEDEEGAYVEKSMSIYGNERLWQKAIVKYKKNIVKRTKEI